MFVAHKPSNILRMKVTKYKDVIRKEDIACIVYYITFNDTNKANVSESNRKLRTRMNEHRKDIMLSCMLMNLDIL